jgi:hypothetical protein
MRIIEITNNLLLPITNEESDLLDKFSSEDSIAKDSLNDREKLLANQLTVKDVLLRTNNNGKIYYKKRAN